MLVTLFGVFVVLHGLVHLLYFGQSARYFELQPGMIWPDAAWATARIIGVETVRVAAGILLVLTALVFAAGGAGILFKQAWWRPLVIGAAVLSTLVYLFFWDGTLQNLDNQGAVAILINVAILAAVLIFRWPEF